MRAHKGMCIIKLRGWTIWTPPAPIPAKRPILPVRTQGCLRGAIFVQDIIGCEVRDAATGAVYGTVRDITHPAASDVYAIQTPQGGTVLFPAVAGISGRAVPAGGVRHRAAHPPVCSTAGRWMPVRIDVATLFPEICEAFMAQSIIGRAQKNGRIEFHAHQIREHTLNRQRQVDDYPYGGGPAW